MGVSSLDFGPPRMGGLSFCSRGVVEASRRGLDPPSGASHELTRDPEKRNDWCKLSGLGEP